MKVWCAAIECKHNKGNQCTLKKINLSEGKVHTKYQGLLQTWQCNNFEESEEYLLMVKMMEELNNGKCKTM